MKVSVITVAFNASATISDTCASVAAQDWADVEHIIVDGGSAKGSVNECLEGNNSAVLGSVACGKF